VKKLGLLLVFLMIAGIAWLFIPWHGTAPEIDTVGDPVRGELAAHAHRQRVDAL